MTRLWLVLILLLVAGSSASAQTLKIYQIDVEQADAALIVMPNGKTLLIDSGEANQGPRIKVAMDDAGVSQIDVFVNSHYHKDHYGSIDDLVEKLKIPVLESFDRGDKACCLDAKKKAEGTFKDYMRTVGEDAKPLRPGNTITLDPLVSITVISSGGGVVGATASTNTRENDFSVSLLLTFAGFTAFFGGDIEGPTEAKIAAGDLVMNVDLYKASHHGSETSSKRPFMEDLKPNVIVISNGSHGGHKHPKQVTLDTYRSLKPAPAVFQTNKCLHPAPCGNVPDGSIADPQSSDEDGTILITVNAATSSYTLAYGSTTLPFTIKNPVAPGTPSGSVVISSLVANPAGDDEQLEVVTLNNKGAATLSLVGWKLRDRSGAAWNLSGSLAPGASRTFRRNGQAMSLNNAGDEVTLIDAASVERDRFEYSVSSEGLVIDTGH